MKTLTIILTLALASGAAMAATAHWTGSSHMVQTVSGKMAWKCEYYYAGQKFWVVMDHCKSSIEVE